MNDATNDRLWTVGDVARYLCVSRRTVYDLPGLTRIRLPGTGGRPIVRYDAADVRKWAQARRERAA